MISGKVYPNPGPVFPFFLIAGNITCRGNSVQCCTCSIWVYIRCIFFSRNLTPYAFLTPGVVLPAVSLLFLGVPSTPKLHLRGPPARISPLCRTTSPITFLPMQLSPSTSLINPLLFCSVNNSSFSLFLTFLIFRLSDGIDKPNPGIGIRLATIDFSKALGFVWLPALFHELISTGFHPYFV